MRTPALLLPLLALTLSACIVNLDLDEEKYTDTRHADVAADGAVRVRVEADAGHLEIEGVPGLDEVRVRGTAVAARQGLLDDVELVAYRSGDEIRIATDLPRFGSAALDLVIEVPEDLLLDIDDTSGDIEVTNTAGLDLIDGSGNVVLRGIYGDIYLEDDSGDLEIYDVAGDVHIEEDDSGNIYITDVDGEVYIREDDSGDIDVANVTGDFTVARDGSGRIHFRNIGGTVRIPR